MKRAIGAMMFALALAGCSSNSMSDRTVGGAVIGAGTGAVVGGLATGRASGAVVGGVVGGAAGALIGRASTPNACLYRDQYGRRYEAPCP